MKQKRWWSMLFWGHSTLLVNSYDMEGEVPMSPYDFRKAIVLAKVDPLGHGAPTQREAFLLKGATQGKCRE